ncbi:MAG TPA: alpha/beta fold hydrolase [Desulfobacteraceae bacterium]|nr:alpha/beta fold hydrolase [Desulfobacteraceae bacterium]
MTTPMAQIFIHGLDSSNQGTKARFFKEKYPDMIIPNFGGPLQERLEKLEKVLSGRSTINLIGSSFGGLMATIFAMDHPDRVKNLILLAPALPMLEALPESGKKLFPTPPGSTTAQRIPCSPWTPSFPSPRGSFPPCTFMWWKMTTCCTTLSGTFPGTNFSRAANPHFLRAIYCGGGCYIARQ